MDAVQAAVSGLTSSNRFHTPATRPAIPVVRLHLPATWPWAAAFGTKRLVPFTLGGSGCRATLWMTTWRPVGVTFNDDGRWVLSGFGGRQLDGPRVYPVSIQCPRCGGTDRTQLAEGYFECTSRVVVGEVPPGVAGPAPIRQWGECGFRYQEAPRTEVPFCHVDGCGMYSVGACVECRQPICGMHMIHVDGRTLCPAHAAQVQAAKARAEQQRKEDDRASIARWVETLGAATSASEVLEALEALTPVATATGLRSGFVQMDVTPPSADQLRHAWWALRTGLGYRHQLELIEVRESGWKGNTPKLTSSPEPLWAYTLWYRDKSNLGEPRTESLLTAISASGDVYSDRDRYGGRFFGFRCERAPWNNKYGYVIRAGDGLRRRKGAAGNAWLVMAAPEPRHPTLRDLAEWAKHGNAPSHELLSELEPYVSEGVFGPRASELVETTTGQSLGLGAWY